MSYDRTPKEMTDTKIENNVEPDKEMSLTTGIREDPVPAQEEPVVEDPESTTKPPIRTIDTGGNPPMISAELRPELCRYLLKILVTKEGGSMAVRHKRRGDTNTYRWIEPTDLVDLSSAKEICIDVETYDKRLTEEKGPGGVFKDGELLGVAITTDDRYSAYYSLNHTDNNWEMDSFVRWFNDQMQNKKQDKIGANILYDLEWLRAYDMEVEGRLIDVQGIEALLDEEAFNYQLVTLSKKYLEDKFWKLGDQLIESCQKYLPNTDLKGKKVYAHLHEVPPDAVGAYAEVDAISTLKIYQAQKPLVQEQELERVLDLECRLLPLLLDMRFQGVKIDLKKLEKARRLINKNTKLYQKKLDKLGGFSVDIHSNDSLGELFDHLGVGYPLTEKTQAPSFQKQWLSVQEHEVCDLLLKARHWSTCGSLFITPIDEYIVGDRIHASFNPLKTDRDKKQQNSKGTYGTVSGRFSSSNPNLQQQPSRGEETAPLIRSLYIPDEGCDFYSKDYSQVEFRILVHYAVALGYPRADEVQQAYMDSPDTDFHVWASELLGLERRIAKDFNFGLIYGMGIKKLAAGLNLPVPEAKKLYDQYNKGIPFAKGLRDYTSRIATKRGYVKTILGRRRRFNKWEPRKWSEEYQKPLPHNEAIEEYGPRIRRAL